MRPEAARTHEPVPDSFRERALENFLQRADIREVVWETRYKDFFSIINRVLKDGEAIAIIPDESWRKVCAELLISEVGDLPELATVIAQIGEIEDGLELISVAEMNTIILEGLNSAEITPDTGEKILSRLPEQFGIRAKAETLKYGDAAGDDSPFN